MALSKVAKSRLNKLIAFMASLPKRADKHFEMGAWFRHEGKGHAHKLDKNGCITKATLTGCGTTACAAGWAATVPAFKRAGFKYQPGIDGFCLSMDPEDFFDVSCEVAEELFYNYDLMTPKQWAAHARKTVRRFSKGDEWYSVEKDL